MYTSPAVADRLGCSANTVRRKLLSGELEGITVVRGKRTMHYVSVESVQTHQKLMAARVLTRSARSQASAQNVSGEHQTSSDDTLHLLELAQLRSDRDQYRSELLVASAAAQVAQQRVAELESELVRLRSVVVLQAEHQAKSLQHLLEPNRPS
jgi:hypothetical protein